MIQMMIVIIIGMIALGLVAVQLGKVIADVCLLVIQGMIVMIVQERLTEPLMLIIVEAVSVALC
jgi:hypothetical protein